MARRRRSRRKKKVDDVLDEPAWKRSKQKKPRFWPVFFGFLGALMVLGCFLFLFFVAIVHFMKTG